MNRDDNSETQCALQVAFHTMKERCLQLQTRLAAVEEENLCLRMQLQKRESEDFVKTYPHDEKPLITSLQGKMDELVNEKAQLTHHIFMIASENRQLWNRLTRLSRVNKSMGSQLKMSNTLKQYPDNDISNALTYSFKDISNLNRDTDKCTVKEGTNEVSLDEISLQLINSIMQEKSELEQQNEMTAWQEGHDLNLHKIGFTYPDDISIDSFEQLKYHDVRLNQVKEALLIQQSKLQDALVKFKKMKSEKLCSRCNENLEYSRPQIESEHSLKRNEGAQTNCPAENVHNYLEQSKRIENNNICPLCGICKFVDDSECFVTHVLSHFTNSN